jgi:hypothetical protein
LGGILFECLKVMTGSFCFHELAIDIATERRLHRNSTVRKGAGSAMQRRRRN